MKNRIVRYFEDRLSNLPDHIIHYILSFLESDEVVKISVLSKRWRYLCASVPYFDLNINSFFSKREMDCDHDAFIDLVNRVLHFQNGSLTLLRFRLNTGSDEEWNIDEWISEAVKRNVQEVDITTCPWENKVELPCSLVNCDSLRVLRLELEYCCLKLPRTGFGRLKSLHLLKAELLVDDSVGGLISSCPLLVDLSLKECGLWKLNILEISSNNLRNLTIENSEYACGGLWDSKLVVSCGKLVSFKYLGPIAKDYIFQNLSSLDTVDIQLVAESKKVKGREVGYLLCKMLHGFHNACALKLCDLFLQFLGEALDEPRWFWQPWYNLKSLKLSARTCPCRVQSILHLLGLSPNLDALVILLTETYGKHEDCQFDDDRVLACLGNRLRTVKLIDFRGKENEFELVRPILQNGHVLETVTINGPVSVWKQAKIIERIKEFSPSSSNVVVKVARGPRFF